MHSIFQTGQHLSAKPFVFGLPDIIVGMSAVPFNHLQNSPKVPIISYIEASITLGDKIRNRSVELQLTIQQLERLLKVTEENQKYIIITNLLKY